MKNTVIFLLFLPFFCSGQVTISGIVNHSNQAVAYANVILLNADDEFVTGTTTNDDGFFELNATAGKYKLKVNHISYEEMNMEVDALNDVLLESIVLAGISTSLEEIVVTTSKATIRREIDKTVVNIENSPIAQAGNIFDALQTAPGLIARNDAIAMLGKNSVRISMDGRMIELSGEELSNFLKSLPASDVTEIEVITNPSAKYEAEGNSGIVNIVTKHINKNAWSNTISATYNQAKYGWQRFNNNFSYQKNNFSLLLSVARNSGSDYIKQIVKPNYSTNPIQIVSKQKRRQNSLSPRILLDYNISESATLGIQYMGSFLKPRTLDDLETTIFNDQLEVHNILLANDVNYDRNRNNSSYNIYFDKKLDTLGKRFTLNFDVLDYRGNTRNNVFSEKYDADLNFIDIEFANEGISSHKIMNYSAKIDVEHPLKWINFSYGTKSSFSNTFYTLNNYNTLSGKPVLIPSQSNEFDFTENIQSAYINSRKKINEHWEFQLGLRAEYTQTKGVAVQFNETIPPFENEYLKFFPTAFVKYNKNEDHVFQINYGRRINRPSYGHLNPSKSFLNGQSSQQGNPFLLPSFSDEIELTHLYKYNLSSKITLRQTFNNYSFIFDLNDEAQQQNITYKNLFNGKGISIMESFHIDITPWWKTQYLLFARYGEFEKIIPTESVALMNGFAYYASINNLLTLNRAKSIIGEVNFWYDSKGNNNLYQLEEAYSLDIAVSFKSIIKGMNVTIGANDLFNSSSRWVTSVINNIEHNFLAIPSTQSFKISLSYHFGNDKIATKKRSFGNEDVRNRSN